MARRNTAHIVKSEREVGQQANGRPEIEYTTWCGEVTKWLWGSRAYSPKDRGCCPACSSAYAAEWLRLFPNGYTLGKNDAAMAKAAGLRSAYPILDAAGETIGAIGSEPGWGKGWAIHYFTDRNGRRGQPVDVQVSTYPLQWEEEDGKFRDGTPRYREFKMDGFSSKEFALGKVPELAAAGRLKSQAVRQKEAEDWKVELARREAAYDAREAAKADQDAAERAHMTEAFRELLEPGVVSNFQREALAIAARRLGLKLDALTTTTEEA